MNTYTSRTHRAKTSVGALVVLGAVGIILAVSCASPALGAFVSPKLAFSHMSGRQVNAGQVSVNKGGAPELEDVCAAGETCQHGVSSVFAGGFANPMGVATGPGPEDRVFVADEGDHRVDVLSRTGVFVSMFGWRVNATKTAEFEEPGDPHGVVEAEENVCLASESSACRAGQSEPNGVAGVIAKPASVAVDRASGNVYVWDAGLHRVEEYTPRGVFVLMVGRNVNKSSVQHPNLCVAGEAGACQTGEAAGVGSTEPLAFKAATHGGVLAVGGPKGLLYVGDEERIQEIEANGTWAGEISLSTLGSGTVNALTVDQEANVYFLYTGSTTVHLYSAVSKLLGNPAGELGTATGISALASDGGGRVAVVRFSGTRHGELYEAEDGRRLSNFASTVEMGAVEALAFNDQNEVFAADRTSQAIEAFAPTPVAELVTSPVSGLSSTGFTLTGEANPEGVANTTAWFEWGLTPALEHRTPTQTICSTGCGTSSVTVSEPLTGLLPNETYYYRIAGEDQAQSAPEPSLLGQTLSVRTSAVAPVFPTEPEAQFVHSESVVFHGVVNPENALTKYRFVYGPCEPVSACANSTPEQESGVYGEVPITQEATGLQPGTVYHYRLVATNEHAQTSESPEGTFTTGPPVTPQAITGGTSAITATSALIGGEVDPDGQPATYLFELGIYNGTSTQYGVVSSGSAGGSASLVSETLQLAGLQPGTTYAYRIRIESGYGGMVGETHLFTTEGLPAILSIPSVLSTLATPQIVFPAATKTVSSRSSGLTRAQKLKRALKACRKQAKHKRTVCERQARKTYSPQPKHKRKGSVKK